MSGETSTAPSSSFTPELTRLLLAEVCERTGLDASGAVLLRHQTNAVYRLLSSPVVIKIARPDYSIAEIERTVALSQWFMKVGAPTLPLLDVDQPVLVGGTAATLWPYLEQDRPVQTHDMAEPLKALHSLPQPSVTLAPIDPVSAIRYSLDAQRTLANPERDVLAARCDELAADLEQLVFESAPMLIHGDPQHRNTLWDDQKALLCDFDCIASGHLEWDLITIEVHSRRFGHSAASYQRFCEIYGRDIRQWVGYATLRDLRELRMITTNARKSVPGSAGMQEVHRRIGEIGHGDPESRWSIL